VAVPPREPDLGRRLARVADAHEGSVGLLATAGRRDRPAARRARLAHRRGRRERRREAHDARRRASARAARLADPAASCALTPLGSTRFASSAALIIQSAAFAYSVDSLNPTAASTRPTRISAVR